MEFSVSINGGEYALNIEVVPIDPMTNPYSDYRGWISPDGEYHPLYGVDGHTKLAREFLGRDTKDPIKELHDAGWVRIVCSNSYSCARLDASTRKILLSSVLKNPTSKRFFISVGGSGLELTRDEAIEYFRGEP